MMVHMLPLEGSLSHHRSFHYKSWFFEKLAEKNGYGMVYNDIIRRVKNTKRLKRVDEWLCAILEKKEDALFMSKQQFRDMGGIV